MKKLIALVLTLACVLALTGCGKNDTYSVLCKKYVDRLKEELMKC